MDYLTVKEVAEKLRVGKRLIITEIHNGDLRAVRFGRRGGFRIQQSDLNEWLEKKKSENK